jgi:hypothetical protein
MSYPKKMLHLAPVRGLVYDTPPHEVPLDAWTFADNARSDNGFLGSHPPQRAAYAELPADPLHLQTVTAGGSNYWIAHYASESHAATGANVFDITLSGGLTTATAKDWTSTVLNGVAVANNSVDPPMYWDGNPGNAMLELPNWPDANLCKTILAYKFHLFALDIEDASGEFPMKVMWSDAAEPGAVPGEWTASASNQAGDAQLSDTPGPVLCGAPIRGSLILYKPSSCYVVDFVEGSDFIFSFRLLSPVRGALTRKAVTPIGTGQHFCVGDGSVYLWDGAQAQDIGEGRINLFDELDQDNYELLHVVHYAAYSEVHINFPESGSSACTRAYVYDYLHDSWSARTLDAVQHAAVGIVNDDTESNLWADADYTWADAQGKWGRSQFSLATQSLLLAGENIIQVGTGTNEKTTVLERAGLHFNSPERFKFVRRVHVRATGSGTLQVQAGAQPTSGAAITYGDPQPFVIGVGQYVNVLAMGRLIAVRIEGAGDFLITGVDIEAELRGYV